MLALIFAEQSLGLFDRHKVLCELPNLCQERFVVSLSNRQMHREQVIQKPEDLEEHCKPVFVHCKHFKRHIKQGLLEVRVKYSVATLGAEDVASYLLGIVEDEFSSTSPY